MDNDIKKIFLTESYKDSQKYYKSILKNSEADFFDYVIITSNNSEQTELYRMEIDMRLKRKMLPDSTKFLIIPDTEDNRLGSGGAVINVLKKISETDVRDFSDLRILLINSGGDSIRLPQCSATGKLFARVGHLNDSCFENTIFDELLIIFCTVVPVMNSGILILSGDVLLIFNAAQCDFREGYTTALTVRADAEMGEKHGVFLSDDNINVLECMQKKSIDELKKNKAVDLNGKVLIDSGVVWIGSHLLNQLKKLECNVNHSVYVDWLYPMTKKSCFDDYLLQPYEGDYKRICDFRKELWEIFHGNDLKIQVLSPAYFFHYGTTKEYQALLNKDNFFNFDSPVRLGYKIINSIPESENIIINENCYIEDSYISSNSEMGKNSIISGIDLLGRSIPDNTVLHGLSLKNDGYIVRIYSVCDNPKENLIFNKSLSEMLNHYNIPANEIFEGDKQILWEAKLYAAAESLSEAYELSIVLYDILHYKADRKTVEKWLKSKRYSLKSSFKSADIFKIYERKNKIAGQIQRNIITAGVKNSTPFKEIIDSLDKKVLNNDDYDILNDIASKESFPVRPRLHLILSDLLPDMKDKTEQEENSFKSIREYIVEGYEFNQQKNCLVSDFSMAELPVRINFGGGWSDTPPYCNEYGGTVLNAAIKINNVNPIKATARRIEKPVICLKSVDLNKQTNITSLDEITDFTNPDDPFALHKAAVYMSGILHKHSNLQDCLKEIGGGIELETTSLLPKGSGLGGSSILAAAAIMALMSITNQITEQHDICTRVLMMEQLMTTGGGWQDQWGAVIPGIKLLKSEAGQAQKISVQQLKLSPDTKKAIQNQFIIIYSGQRRLAKNLLRTVMKKVIQSDVSSLRILSEIQDLAVLMSYELERGNIREFGRLMNEHRLYLLELNPSFTNRYIELIFEICKDLTYGNMICGAGNGGFLQLLLKENVTKEMVDKKLESVFGTDKPVIYPIQFIY